MMASGMRVVTGVSAVRVLQDEPRRQLVMRHAPRARAALQPCLPSTQPRFRPHHLWPDGHGVSQLT